MKDDEKAEPDLMKLARYPIFDIRDCYYQQHPFSQPNSTTTLNMRLFPFLLLSCWQAIATASSSSPSAALIDHATISIQRVGELGAPSPLATIEYNPSTLLAEITSYEPPAFDDASDDDTANELMRIGVYDDAMGRWRSSTSTTAARSFTKGYAPTFVVSLDAQGGIIGVSCKSSVIDAGYTRDFGPKVVVRSAAPAKQPELNRPVVVSPDGKPEEAPVEKTLLQKYWWVLLGLLMLVVSGGGEH